MKNKNMLIAAILCVPDSMVRMVTSDRNFSDDNYSSTFFGKVRPVITIS